MSSYKDWVGNNLTDFRAGSAGDIVDITFSTAFKEYDLRKALAPNICETCGVFIEDEHRCICLDCWSEFIGSLLYRKYEGMKE